MHAGASADYASLIEGGRASAAAGEAWTPNPTLTLTLTPTLTPTLTSTLTPSVTRWRWALRGVLLELRRHAPSKLLTTNHILLTNFY